MKITIISVGKLKEAYLLDGIAEYVKRLSKYTKIEEIVLNDEAIKEKTNEKIDKEDMVSYSKSAFGMDVLVADKMKCSAKYPDILMDEAGLDDIMVFYVNQKQS